MADKWARWLHKPCCLGGRHTSIKRGVELEVAHKWAGRLHNPCYVTNAFVTTALGVLA